ncbi:MAG: signal peptidase II [bacterium]|nr:signal peptidase II [bacterium]
MSLRWPSFALAFAFVVADQVTKAWAVAEVPLGARVASWAGLVHLTHTRNSGAAFGLLRDRTLDLGVVSIDGVQLLGLISLVVAIALAAWLLRSRSLDPFTRLALGAIMGGAIGNGIDRWRLHYVTDFVHLQAGRFDFPVFNVADIGISLGATALVVSTLIGGQRSEHSERSDGWDADAGADAGADAAGPPPDPTHPAPHDGAPPADVDGVRIVETNADDVADTGVTSANVNDAPTRTANDR